MDVLGQNKDGDLLGQSMLGNNDEINLDEEIDNYFDFVMIEMDEIR